MKYRNGFVSNSSSTSFVIEFDKDKDVNIKIPLGLLLQCLDTDYFPFCDNEKEEREFTQENINNKEFSSAWGIKENKIFGEMRYSGEGPNFIEKLIYDQYGGIHQFFKENGVKYEDPK